MTLLSEKFFEGVNELTNTEKLLTDGSDKSVTDTLTALGWEGQLIGAVVLDLAVDGESVTNGRLILRGRISKDAIALQANKLWASGGKDLMLIVKIPTGDEFKFDDGCLASNYLDEGDLEFSVTKAGTVLEEDQWEAAGIGNFSMRIVAHLDKAANGPKGHLLKLTAMLFPLNKKQLQELSTVTKLAAWPGIKCYEEKCPLFPDAMADGWGTPFKPLLGIANRASNSDNTPMAVHLRYAVALLMRTAVVPEALASCASVQKRCKAIVADPAAAGNKEPDIVWPEMIRPESEKGKIPQFNNMGNQIIYSLTYKGETIQQRGNNR